MSNWLNDSEVLIGQGSGEAPPWSPRQRGIPSGSPRPGRGRGLLASPSTRESTVGTLQPETTGKAKELFLLCDKEGKGFITKRDMQRLQEELSMSPEQLEEVFESLDRENVGFLTAAEFKMGLGGLMGLEETPDQSQDEAEEDKGEVDWTQDPSAIRFLNTLVELGADKLFKDQWELCSLWCELQRERPELISVLEDILYHSASHLQDTLRERESLEQALRRRENEHDQAVRSLYEEMESQVREEKEKQLAQDNIRQWDKGQQLREELKMREQELESALDKHRELKSQIQLLTCELIDTKDRNQQQQSLNFHLQEQLETSREQLQTALAQLNHIHLNTAQEQAAQQRSVLKVSRNMQKEKDSLLRQLELLRDMNKRMRDEKDAHQSQKRSRHVRKTLQKKGSIIGNYLLQDMPVRSQLSPSSQWAENTGEMSKSFERHPPPHGVGCENTRASAQSGVAGPQRLFKVVLIGNSGVGKSCFIQRCCTGHFCSTLSATVGIDYQMKTVALGSTTVVLQLWDTAGQERFRSITQQYYRKADGIIVMYDITQSPSFTAVRGWMDLVQVGGWMEMSWTV
ncbi:EF-hand calcium-binding domain-containing protein 4A [Lampris incognitus]|uniref:EF-hand calcium-binding domain-containing protein 4A n=1 Tax=Lampris incognitus TaxID=2546036 RepID=UPI0024B59E34|nr:EF-hand calcium-binding domain-containing protein 4A [Lampris incognitus]